MPLSRRRLHLPDSLLFHGIPTSWVGRFLYEVDDESSSRMVYSSVHCHYHSSAKFRWRKRMASVYLFVETVFSSDLIECRVDADAMVPTGGIALPSPAALDEKIDRELDIVVRMPPLSKRKVRARTRKILRAEPVVVEPDSGEVI